MLRGPTTESGSHHTNVNDNRITYFQCKHCAAKKNLKKQSQKYYKIYITGRREALLSFRRAPRGLALRRCRTGITTQQRLRSPPPGILGPRPLLLMIAAKVPSQCIAHASKRTHVHAPLCAQGPSAPLHTPPPAHMLKARKQLAQRIPDSTHTQKLNLPKAKLTTRGACREPFHIGKTPCPLPRKGKRGPPKRGFWL